MEKTGKAYGFLYYAGKREAIQKELPAIRKKVKTPLEMGLSVRGINSLDNQKDSALAEIAERAKSASINYVIEADLPGESNQRTARELECVFTGLRYQLYDKSEPFCAEVAYKRGGKYVFREK